MARHESDVDPEHRLLIVARSGTRDTTKGGNADVVPIHAELIRRVPVEDLEDFVPAARSIG